MPVQISIFLKFLPNPISTSWKPLTKLSDYEKYITSGGEEYYWNAVPLAHGKQLAVVLGGYLGTSAALLARKGYRVIAFEPVESFADAIEKKAAVEALPIQVVRTGAGNYDGIFRLSIDQDSTSMFGNASKPQAEFNVTHFSRWLRDLNQQVAVLEVNIEGGEYPVLEDLIESSEIQMVKRLLVQFHNFDSTHDMQRNAIRLSLEKTHSQDFNFPWVWECWSRRER